jgi:uncharacterized protein involved in exopolysaccharide biosynthesis
MQLQTLRGGRTIALAGLIGLLLGAGCWFVMPTRYRSTATLGVYSSTPLGSDRFDADMVKMLLTRQSLGGIIKKYKLYPADQAKMPLEDVVDEMFKNIHVRPVGMLMMVQFEYSDPVMAQNVTNDLVSNTFQESLQLSFNSGSTLSYESIRLLDPGSLSKDPISPKPMQMTMAGLTGGCMVGFLITLLRRQTSVMAG